MSLLITFLAVSIAFAVYGAILRPRLRAAYPNFYARVEDVETSWCGALWARATKFWDVVAAGALVIGPELPDLLQEIAAIDMGALMPDTAAKAITKLIGIGLAIGRVWAVLAKAKAA